MVLGEGKRGKRGNEGRTRVSPHFSLSEDDKNPRSKIRDRLWWRRRELNPRPRKSIAKRLRAFPVRYFSTAPCGTGKRGMA